MKHTSWSTGLSFSADGTGVVAHAGNVATRLLADRVGLTDALSGALARRGFTPTHDRGRVLVDVAVLIAGGGEAIADIDVLRHQGEVLGSVASAPMVWRTLSEMTPVAMKRIEKARARVRAHVWSQLPGGLPASKVADTDLGDTVVLDVDATLVASHSEKEGAAVTFKKGFGYHPLGVWCENTQESMALMLRPGNAGSNTAADHIAVLTAAIAQVPAAHGKKLLIRAHGAGASHELLAWITGLDAKRGRSVEYSVGYAVTQHVRDAIARVSKTAWKPAVTATGQPQEHGDVEITGMLNLKKWPVGMRVLIRREHPHPGASLTLFEHADGWRYQAVATNTPVATGGQVAFLEARHRAHARVETRIRHAKDSGIGRFPSREYDINAAWAIAASISADLIAWLRLLALPPGLKACEPKALRYRFLQVPARLTKPGLLARMESQWKLSRGMGIANLMVIHRLSDLDAVGNADSEARALAQGLLADCSTKIIYQQETSEAPHTASLIGLSSAERAQLPDLQVGEGLWRVAQRAFVVLHRGGVEHRPPRLDRQGDPALRRELENVQAAGCVRSSAWCGETCLHDPRHDPPGPDRFRTWLHRTESEVDGLAPGVEVDCLGPLFAECVRG